MKIMTTSGKASLLIKNIIVFFIQFAIIPLNIHIPEEITFEKADSTGRSRFFNL
jgi:hypothetical protein